MTTASCSLLCPSVVSSAIHTRHLALVILAITDSFTRSPAADMSILDGSRKVCSISFCRHHVCTQSRVSPSCAVMQLLTPEDFHHSYPIPRHLPQVAHSQSDVPAVRCFAGRMLEWCQPLDEGGFGSAQLLLRALDLTSCEHCYRHAQILSRSPACQAHFSCDILSHDDTTAHRSCPSSRPSELAALLLRCLVSVRGQVLVRQHQTLPQNELMARKMRLFYCRLYSQQARESR